MAVVSPFVPSPGGLKSAFSPFTDSPSSPLLYQTGFPGPNRTSASSDSLAPPPPSPYPQHVDPSPTDSNGTESTDIEEDAQDQVEDDEATPKTEPQVSRPQSRESLIKIDTAVAVIRSRSNSDEAPPSVIHAPSGFRELNMANAVDSDYITQRSGYGSDHSTTSPVTPDAALGPSDRRMSSVTSPHNTDIPSERTHDRSTPHAQTRQEAEEEWKRRSRRTSSLEDIPETLVMYSADSFDFGELRETQNSSSQTGPETERALHDCWTLCNTLSNLSSNHRQRMFTMSGKSSAGEHAWRSCWRLCQQLYGSHNQARSQTLPTLELCREFCQALFDVRHKGDEAADSVLRVSFEMNNHLYNTHDRNLPEAFRERTLDFYVTLCHRLMKLRTSLVHETDSLLRACWSLAESLFNLRQTGRDSKKPDDEVLATAVQACWDLCDLFREGWSQIRPDRTTPRPGQTSFPPSVKHYSSNHSERAPSSLSSSEYHDAPSLPPETPTTIFDDATTVSSPESIDVPNILVLGPASNSGSTRGVTHHDRWSSNASTLSDYSESIETSSQRTSSTARAGSDNANLLRLRCLIIKAAMNLGYIRGQSLPAFASSLPLNAFGTQSWQTQLLECYKQLVVADQSLRPATTMPSRRLKAQEVSKAVVWLSRNEDWKWLKDLFRVVFGFTVEEAGAKGGFFQI